MPARAAFTPTFTRPPLSEVFSLSQEPSDGFSPSDPTPCSEETSVETTTCSSERDVSGYSAEDSLCSSSEAIGANLGETMGVRGHAVNLI
jgi:hypothetical protein